MARDEKTSSRSVAAVSYDSRILLLLKKHNHWGYVLNQFGKAIDIHLPSGDLITLVPEASLNGPGFVCLPFWPVDRFMEAGIRIPEVAHFISAAGETLNGPPAGLIVDLRSARPWLPPLFPRPPSHLSALKNVVASLFHDCPPPGRYSYRLGRFLPPGRLDYELKARTESLLNSIRSQQIGDFENAFIALLGLGIGLTPSGDDFLAGALAAAWWLKGTRPADFLREEAAKLIARHGEKTTPASRHFLSAAAEGVFCEFVYRFLESLSTGDNKSIARWTEYIRGWGATSGSWLLHGFASTAAALIGIGE